MPEVDLSDAGCVRIGEFRLPLGPVRWGLLKLLVKANGRCVSKEQIMQSLYGMSREPPGDHVVNVHLCHLRRRLKGSGIAIGTRYSWGWYLRPE